MNMTMGSDRSNDAPSPISKDSEYGQRPNQESVHEMMVQQGAVYTPRAVDLPRLPSEAFPEGKKSEVKQVSPMPTEYKTEQRLRETELRETEQGSYRPSAATSRQQTLAANQEAYGSVHTPIRPSSVQLQPPDQQLPDRQSGQMSLSGQSQPGSQQQHNVFTDYKPIFGMSTQVSGQSRGDSRMNLNLGPAPVYDDQDDAASYQQLRGSVRRDSQARLEAMERHRREMEGDDDRSDDRNRSYAVDEQGFEYGEVVNPHMDEQERIRRKKDQ